MSQRVFYTGLAALPFLAPFLVYQHTNPLPSFYMEWVAGLCGLVLTGTLLFTVRSACLAIPWLALAALPLTAVLLLQRGLGMVAYAGQTHLAILYLMLFLSVATAAGQLRQDTEPRTLAAGIAWALIAGGSFNALLGVIQLADIPTFLDDFLTRGTSALPFGNITQANHFAAFETLAFLGVLYLVALGNGSRFLLLSAASLILAGMALSGSRSVWLYLPAAWIIAATLPREIPQRRFMLWGLVVAFLAFIAIQISLKWIVPGLTTAAERLSSAQEYSSIAVRLGMWREALVALRLHPLLGVGHQGTAWWHFLSQVSEYNPVFSEILEDKHLENAHNIVLQLGAEYGITGLAVGLFAAYWIVGRLLRTRSLTDWYIGSMIIVVAIHSLLEYPLYYAHFLVLFGVLVGLADDRPLVVPLSKSLVRPLIALSIMIGGAFLALCYSNYNALEELYARASGGKVSVDGKTLMLAETAERGTFFSPQVEEFINGIEVRAFAEESLPNLLAASDRVLRYHAKATYVFRHVDLLRKTGRSAEASALLEKAQKAYPAKAKSLETR